MFLIELQPKTVSKPPWSRAAVTTCQRGISTEVMYNIWACITHGTPPNTCQGYLRYRNLHIYSYFPLLTISITLGLLWRALNGHRLKNTKRTPVYLLNSLFDHMSRLVSIVSIGSVASDIGRFTSLEVRVVSGRRPASSFKLRRLCLNQVYFQPQVCDCHVQLG